MVIFRLHAIVNVDARDEEGNRDAFSCGFCGGKLAGEE